MQVDHKCHNPACVRPDHLQLATPKENSKNRRQRKICQNGHLMLGDNLHVTPRGTHQCVICREARMARVRKRLNTKYREDEAYRERAKQRAHAGHLRRNPDTRPRGMEDECHRGHDLNDPNNIAYRGDGKRYCLPCNRINAHDYYHSKVKKRPAQVVV